MKFFVGEAIDAGRGHRSAASYRAALGFISQTPTIQATELQGRLAVDGFGLDRIQCCDEL
jgi:hypothetical protein